MKKGEKGEMGDFEDGLIGWINIKWIDKQAIFLGFFI